MAEIERPQEVFLISENPYLCLYEGDTVTAVVSLQRFSYSKRGAGVVSLVWADLKGDGFSPEDDYTACLTDNVALARWFKDEMAPQYPGMIEVPNYETMPIVEADYFASSGDLGDAYTETMRAEGVEIVATWRDMAEHVRLALPPTEVWPFTVASILVPVSSAEVTVNGVRAVGQTKPEEFRDLPSTITDQELAHLVHASGALAFGEIWTAPDEG